MSVTDELRRLLDERGVEYRTHSTTYCREGKVMKKFLFGFAFGLSFTSAMLKVADGGDDRDVFRYALAAAASLLGLVFA